MVLLEVYVQGVSRFLAPFKFSLGKGYNVVYGGNETGKTALAQALAATFDGAHAQAANGRLQPVIPQDGNGRYGALFEHNGARYRLLRDLQGGLNLAKLDAATQKFSPIAKDEAGLQQFLQDDLDFPMDGLFTLIGLIDRHLAPAGGPVSSSSASTYAAPASSYDDQFSSYEDEAAPAASGDLESQLKQLKRELHILSSVDQLEFKVDELTNKKFETEAAIAKFKEIDAKLAKLDARNVEIQAIEKLTPDLEARVKNLDKQEEYQRTKLHSLDGELAILEKQLDVLEPKISKKFHKDPFFLGGAVAALLGFILPFFVTEFLSLIGLAALGWLGYLFFMVYPKVQAEHDEVQKKYKSKIAEEERIKKDFETATAIIKELVKTLRVLDAKDLVEVAAEYRQNKSDIDALKQERDDFSKSNGGPEKLMKDFERQDAEIALFQEELRNAGAITRDMNQLRAEISRLEALQASGGTLASAVAAPAAAHVAASPMAELSGGTGSSVASLLQAAATLARNDVDWVLSVATDKVNTYLRAFSGGKLGPAEMTADGSLSLSRSEFGSQRFTLDQLSDGARDTVLLCVRFGLLETVLPTRQFPVVLDDPFGLLDDQRQAVAAKALKRIASLTQVIHFAAQKSFLALADVKAELK